MDNASKHRPKTAGFTLLELLTTIAVVAILAAVGVPSMREFIRNNRLTGDANDLLRSLQQARSEAIKGQRNVTVCISSNPTAGTGATCSFGNGTGWIVFQDSTPNWQHDATEPVLSAQTFSSGVNVSSDKSAVMSYASSGFKVPASAQTPSEHIVLYDDRGNAQTGNNSTARAVLISDTGRPRVSKLYSEVKEACEKVGLDSDCT